MLLAAISGSTIVELVTTIGGVTVAGLTLSTALLTHQERRQKALQASVGERPEPNGEVHTTLWKETVRTEEGLNDTRSELRDALNELHANQTQLKDTRQQLVETRDELHAMSNALEVLNRSFMECQEHLSDGLFRISELERQKEEEHQKEREAEHGQ